MLLSYINILISFILSFVDAGLRMIGLENKPIPVFSIGKMGCFPVIKGEISSNSSNIHVSPWVYRMTSTVSGRKKWLTNSSIFILWFGSLIPASFTGAGRGSTPFTQRLYAHFRGVNQGAAERCVWYQKFKTADSFKTTDRCL